MALPKSLVLLLILACYVYTLSLPLTFLLGPSSSRQNSLSLPLSLRFNSVKASFVTICELIFRGQEYGTLVVSPLYQNYPTILVGIVIAAGHIATQFVVLNLLGGYLIEAVHGLAHFNQQIYVEEAKLKSWARIDHLRHTLQRIDEDGSGGITWDEFSLGFSQSGAELRSELGLHMEEVHRLFMLMDMDHSGVVSIDEIVLGLLNMLCPLDRLILQHEQHQAVSRILSHSQFRQTSLNCLSEELEACDRELNKALVSTAGFTSTPFAENVSASISERSLPSTWRKEPITQEAKPSRKTSLEDCCLCRHAFRNVASHALETKARTQVQEQLKQFLECKDIRGVLRALAPDHNEELISTDL